MHWRETGGSDALPVIFASCFLEQPKPRSRPQKTMMPTVARGRKRPSPAQAVTAGSRRTADKTVLCIFKYRRCSTEQIRHAQSQFVSLNVAGRHFDHFSFTISCPKTLIHPRGSLQTIQKSWNPAALDEQ